VGSALFKLKKIAHVNQDAVCLLIGNTEIDEKSHKAGQLVEYQVLVVLQFFFDLLFFRLQHSLQKFA